LDRQTFEQLALEHMDSVYRMAMSLTKHPDTAGDLVQETYLRALRSADRFEERGKGMRAWLFTILHNTFYTKVKRAKLGPTSVPELFDAESREEAPDTEGVAWDLRSLNWDQVDGELKKAIDDLNDEHREVLLLWGVEGLKYREISEIVGVPIGTVMSRLHRARKILMDSLEEFARERGFTKAADQ
jgi:RNA polymerase sigma-70 factor (ECF subfamily)